MVDSLGAKPQAFNDTDSQDTADPPSDENGMPSTALPLVTCNVDLDCPAWSPCLGGMCLAGHCTTRVLADGSACNDQSACTFGDLCSAGQCRGSPVQCSDGNTCTEDVCDPKNGCHYFTLKDKPCDGGATCVLHQCSDGSCEATGLPACDDNNPCTVDLCTQEIGCHFEKLEGTICEDGNPCTAADICQFGKCAGLGESCNDGNPCTDDTCAPGGGCVHVPHNKLCSDGDFCTSWDRCQGGQCKGTAKVCVDGDPCTEGVCDTQTGMCGAQVTVDGTVCDDGTACTTGTKCAGGVCTGTWKTCDDGDACTIDACNALNGQCVFAAMDGCVGT